VKKSPRFGPSRKDLMNCSCSHQSIIRGLCEAAVCRLFLCRFINFMKWPYVVFSRALCLYRNVTTRISLLLSPMTISMSLSCPFTTILVPLVFIVLVKGIFHFALLFSLQTIPGETATNAGCRIFLDQQAYVSLIQLVSAF
jgi:hypothetical protein